MNAAQGDCGEGGAAPPELGASADHAIGVPPSVGFGLDMERLEAAHAIFFGVSASAAGVIAILKAVSAGAVVMAASIHGLMVS